jgi:hypothetical protein
MLLAAFKQVKGYNDKFADDHKNVITTHEALKRMPRNQFDDIYTKLSRSRDINVTVMMRQQTAEVDAKCREVATSEMRLGQLERDSRVSQDEVCNLLVRSRY